MLSTCVEKSGGAPKLDQETTAFGDDVNDDGQYGRVALRIGIYYNAVLSECVGAYNTMHTYANILDYMYEWTMNGTRG